MNDLVTLLTTRGQTSVPASIRRKIGMRPGSALRWEMKSSSELSVRLEPDTSPAGAFAALGYAKRWLAPGEVVGSDEVLKELRDGEDV